MNMQTNSTEIVSYPEFLNRSKKTMMRPGMWKWEEIEQKLTDSIGYNSNEPGRGAVSLIHKDTGHANGVSPTINVVVQVLEPGRSYEPHKHSNVAFFLVKQGKGYSIVDGERLDWKEGDIVVAPAWSAHEHGNTSDTENAILVTFQDVPLVNHMGIMFLEEPLGTSIRHLVRRSVTQDKQSK
jgi:gentisate 1,2-dioxygenase